MRVTHKAIRFTAAALAVALSASPAVGARLRRGPTSPKSAKASKSSKSSHASKTPIGPRSMDDARALQIQNALIKAGYLNGEPSGHWDSTSQAAMEKLQSDNGWQTKLVPDSRALIKLGLGPGASDTTTASAANFNASAKNE